MKTAQVHLPNKLIPVFGPPRGTFQYRGMFGGRGSGKSFSAAIMAAVLGYAEPMRILCAREYQSSIAESFHAELKAAIASQPWLSDHYDVGKDYLRGRNGTEFIFRGLRHAVNSVRSLAKIDLTIVEEAEDIPDASWLALEATVFRQPRSELWPIWNPRKDGSPVDQRFRKTPPARSIIVEVNWQDNPFFPPGMEELRQREQARLDPSTYAHVWEGAYLENSDAQVLRDRIRVEAVVPQPGWAGPYFGADWGFSVDPTTLVKLWVNERTLYVEKEAYGAQVDIDNTPALFDKIEGAREHIIRADNARPETISYMQRHGYPRCVAADKWPGSVEDGVEHLRSYERIVVDPRCVNAIRESRLWCWKRDRLTQDVLPALAAGNDHIWDAARYALGPLIKRRTTSRPIHMPIMGR